jgi:prevent-host-death family protein
MPITRARINLGAVVKRVRETGRRVVLEKGGIPVAAIVDPQWIEDMEDGLALMRLRELHAGEIGEDVKVVLRRYGLYNCCLLNRRKGVTGSTR